jgi:hypothetical protein
MHPLDTVASSRIGGDRHAEMTGEMFRASSRRSRCRGPQLAPRHHRRPRRSYGLFLPRTSRRHRDRRHASSVSRTTSRRFRPMSRSVPMANCSGRPCRVAKARWAASTGSTGGRATPPGSRPASKAQRTSPSTRAGTSSSLRSTAARSLRSCGDGRSRSRRCQASWPAVTGGQGPGTVVVLGR